MGFSPTWKRLLVRAGTRREATGMWIREVDFPVELVEAARAARLVIFVGAGASMDEPAGLPSFTELVRDIGTRASRPPSAEDLRRPDEYLGRLKDAGIDIHKLVEEALSRSEASPNKLHEAIVDLARAYEPLRIVTTNYDQFLTAVVKDRGDQVEVFRAPALPVGDDFTGIVHLHGALGQEPRQLVACDRDFGRAYLRDAWAARFLDRMFANFSVLFVGYSHGDVVMRYLARSLGPTGQRFVLTDHPENADWTALGLIPIGYDAVDGDHSALRRALAAWAELGAMGLTDHRSRIVSLVEQGPPTIPEEISYVEEVFRDTRRVKYFTGAATSIAWLEWFLARPEFGALFEMSRSHTEAERTLVAWLIDNYLADEPGALRLLRAWRGRPWHPHFWEILVHRLFAGEGEFSKWLQPWVVLALEHAPRPKSDLLDMLLARHTWGASNDLALLAFENRTRAIISPGFDYGKPQGPVRIDVEIAGEEHWLSTAWTGGLRDVRTHAPVQWLALVDRQVRALYNAYRAASSSSFDPLSFRRSAIEPHSQDEFRDSIDVLVDAARDCLVLGLEQVPDIAGAYVEAWGASDVAILRRVAVHGQRTRSDMVANAKLDWLLENDMLWDLEAQHEVYELLAAIVAEIGEDRLEGLIETVQHGPGEAIKEGDEAALRAANYRRYNLLGWLARCAPARTSTRVAFKDAQAAHPEFAPREHPDLNTFMSSGWVDDSPVIGASELHALIGQGPAQAIDRLSQLIDQKTDPFGSNGSRAAKAITECVAANPEDGFAVLGALGPDQDELRGAVLRGWDAATLPDVDAALAVIASWNVASLRPEITSVLASGGREGHPNGWHLYPRARALALDLWPAEATQGVLSGSDDRLLLAINHPAGQLAQFWTNAVQALWANAGGEWEGMQGDVKQALEQMVADSSVNGLRACTVLCAHLRFFYGADAEWTRAHLLPMFEWDADRERAISAWHGFLSWGQSDDGLLAAGLLDLMIKGTAHESELGETFAPRLASHLASVALRPTVSPIEWLMPWVATSRESTRVHWADAMTRHLAELGADAAETVWDVWIRSYWRERAASIPLPLSKSEASQMAHWILALGASRAEAIGLVAQTPAALDGQGYLLMKLEDLDIESDVGAWISLLEHLLRNTTSFDWGLEHYLRPLVSRLRKADPSVDLSEIVEHAMKLGCVSAPDWLAHDLDE